jgi:hypothetical protein
MNRFIALAIAVFGTGAIASELNAQIEERPRLPREVLDVAPPSERVSGNPGQVNIRPLACQNIPLAESRRRIVNIAVQEWAFFGFPIADLTDFDDDLPAQRNAALSNQANIYGFSFSPLRRGGRFRALPVGEASRVASSVVGYWAATPRGATMIDRQNQEWNGPQGLTGRWADPWSAAFISWVMCEGGLGESNQFQRAIAHWTYIDQAINARDGRARQSAFVAYDLGEETIAPGDLLCSGRRPAYRNIAQRRRQLGVGARTHCDIVVKLDETEERIFTIGGNVRRSVTLKLFPAETDASGKLRPTDPPEGADMRPLFAHLKHRADPIGPNALDSSPTLRALDCELKFEERHLAFNLMPVSLAEGEC